MITVIDSICGSGKTSWAIQEINNNTDKKYIYVTPYLDETERVRKECYNRAMRTPDEKLGKGSKKNHFMDLVEEGCNIVSTHALFRSITPEVIDLIKKNKYTLILDEVMNVIEKIPMDKTDFKMLLNEGIISIEEDSKRILWSEDKLNYNGKFKDLKNSILNGDVYYVRNSLIMWSFPCNIFKSFQDVYVLTYMFKGQVQRYYYDMNDIKYEYKSVEYSHTEGFGSLATRVYKLVDYRDADKTRLKELINILENSKKNKIGEEGKNYHPLSVSWFKKQEEEKLDGLKVLKNNIYGFFMNDCKSKSKDNAWTVFLDYKSKCKGKGYSNGYMSFNIRATNEFRHKRCFAYCVNLYQNPMDIAFFTDKGVKIDEDAWALSEMIQFLFRGCIRDDKPMELYIPSSRMRNLLIGWLNS